MFHCNASAWEKVITLVREYPKYVCSKNNNHKQGVLGRTCGNFYTDCVWYNKRTAETMN